MENRDVARVLDEIAQLLELKGENAFKVRSYQNAAREIEGLNESISERALGGHLDGIPGVGKSIAEKILELCKTGELGFLTDLRREIPSGLLELLKLPNMGPKKAKKLFDELGVRSLSDLEVACKSGKLLTLKGFGEKTQAKLLEAIGRLASMRGRVLLRDGLRSGQALVEHLRQGGHKGPLEVAGSVRRRRETIGDVDIVAAAEGVAAEKLADRFASYVGVVELLGKGPTKTSVRLADGIQADLRVVPPASFPAALHHFTGSKAHHVKLRGLALRRGYSISEYGLERVDDRSKTHPRSKADEPAAAAPAVVKASKPDGAAPPRGPVVHPKSEADLYRILGLPYIPPELREDQGEIEAALEGRMPELLPQNGLRGVFHVHTDWSDGTASVVDMARAAARLGFSYVGISDHSKAAAYAGGLDEARLVRQADAVAEAQKAVEADRIHILHGVEVDILPDGRLDLDDEALGRLDFVIASVHSHLEQPRSEMTARIVRAIRHPLVTMLGHPTQRLLLGREGYEVDLDLVAEAAAGSGVALEINVHHKRLDLDWTVVKRLRQQHRGLRFAVNPDAHSIEGLKDAIAGVGVARKAWLSAAEVINAMPLDALLGWLRERRRRAIGQRDLRPCP